MEYKSLDPRPDLTRDSHLWEALLNLASEDQGPESLYGALRGFRCLGAELTPSGSSLHIRPGEIGSVAGDDYVVLRTRYLLPHRDRLTALLGEALRAFPVSITRSARVSQPSAA